MSVHSTLGAALAGGMVAIGLSAMVGFQAAIYYLVFPQDTALYKLLVGVIWLSDAVHTVLVCSSIWQYTISNFGNSGIEAHIFPSVAVNITMTAFITLIVNAFYGWRIHKLSKGNWWITGPVILLSAARFGLGLASTVEMFNEDNFPAFAAHFKVLFTSGLMLSALTDVYVSIARYWYLRNLKEGYMVTREMVDTTVVFTVNDGILTCLVVIASMACWLGMSHNFIYLGIYFTIAKLYSNSILATLNLRNWFRHRYNVPRRQQLGLVVTRGGRVSGYPLDSANSSHFKSHPPQTTSSEQDSKGGQMTRAASEDGDRAPSRLEVIIDTTHQVTYDESDELQLFDNSSDRGTKAQALMPTASAV